MLKYQYHDAMLESVELGSDQQVTLIISLYPIFYPEKTRVSVRLNEIFNFTSFSKYLSPICAEKYEDPTDPFLGTCESLQIDSKFPSSEGSLYFFIKISGFGSFRPHCKGMSETLLAPQNESPSA